MLTMRYASRMRSGDQQAHEFTLAWPALRSCVRRVGQQLTDTGAVEEPDDIFFCTRDELQATPADGTGERIAGIGERREEWQHQRRPTAPLTLGPPAPLIGDVIDRAVQQARGTIDVAEGVIVGHPASAGRATGPVHIVDGPADFAKFADGDVLVAKATAPAWTPLSRAWARHRGPSPAHCFRHSAHTGTSGRCVLYLRLTAMMVANHHRRGDSLSELAPAVHPYAAPNVPASRSSPKIPRHSDRVEPIGVGVRACRRRFCQRLPRPRRHSDARMRRDGRG
jgi:hypothetical protein